MSEPFDTLDRLESAGVEEWCADHGVEEGDYGDFWWVLGPDYRTRCRACSWVCDPADNMWLSILAHIKTCKAIRPYLARALLDGEANADLHR